MSLPTDLASRGNVYFTEALVAEFDKDPKVKVGSLAAALFAGVLAVTLSRDFPLWLTLLYVPMVTLGVYVQLRDLLKSRRARRCIPAEAIDLVACAKYGAGDFDWDHLTVDHVPTPSVGKPVWVTTAGGRKCRLEYLPYKSGLSLRVRVS